MKIRHVVISSIAVLSAAVVLVSASAARKSLPTHPRRGPRIASTSRLSNGT